MIIITVVVIAVVYMTVHCVLVCAVSVHASRVVHVL